MPAAVGWRRGKPWGGSGRSSTRVGDWKGDNQHGPRKGRWTRWEQRWGGDQLESEQWVKVVCVGDCCWRGLNLCLGASSSWALILFCSEAACKFSFFFFLLYVCSHIHEIVIMAIVCIKVVSGGLKCHCSSETAEMCWPSFVPTVDKCLPRWQIKGLLSSSWVTTAMKRVWTPSCTTADLLA